MTFNLILKGGTSFYEKDGEVILGKIYIYIKDEKICYISNEDKNLSAENTIALDNDRIVVPPFYGTHSHGGGKLIIPCFGRYDFGSDRFCFERGQIKQNIAEVLLAHGQTGTGAMHISAMACDQGCLDALIEESASLVGQRDVKSNSASLAGMDLEGQFFYPGPNLGVQDRTKLQPPTIENIQRYLRASHGSLRRVCIGMEWAQEGVDTVATVSDLQEKGIVVGLGHTCASEEQIKEAIMNNGRYVWVHATNAQTTFNAKTGQFSILEGIGDYLDLAEQRKAAFYAELITDNKHVDVRGALWVRSMFGADKIILIDDNAGSTDRSIKRFDISHGDDEHHIWACLSKDGQVYVMEGTDEKKFAGTNITMYGCFINYINFLMNNENGGPIPMFRSPRERHQPLGFHDAVREAVMASSLNPAILYRATDFGSIREGGYADMLVFQVLKDTYPVSLRLDSTIRNGKLVQQQ